LGSNAAGVQELCRDRRGSAGARASDIGQSIIIIFAAAFAAARGAAASSAGAAGAGVEASWRVARLGQEPAANAWVTMWMELVAPQGAAAVGSEDAGRQPEQQGQGAGP